MIKTIWNVQTNMYEVWFDVSPEQADDCIGNGALPDEMHHDVVSSLRCKVVETAIAKERRRIR